MKKAKTFGPKSAMAETSAPATNTMTVEPAPEDPNSTFQVNDLRLVLNLIEVCSQRGAFKANELAVVGTLFNKITGFLDKAGLLNPAPQPEPVAEPEGVN
jgi:hypothetical protein